MSRLCAEVDQDPGENDSGHYMKGYNINYSTASSESVVSDSVASIKSKKKSPPKTETTLTSDEIRDRCRISYECRNNMICIEGHPKGKK
ncbi:hypothetical protein TcasGA2_TC031575 [Tribolium castaneum]|uniref:Uncharacterized protein n=1 Tax=Tribolium castaneum TaxID=7070 RepID=A0A139WPS6_TRICA|nr:hypothetical protein TcasGA2_TC031575 [Tribolium castaneum]